MYKPTKKNIIIFIIGFSLVGFCLLTGYIIGRAAGTRQKDLDNAAQHVETTISTVTANTGAANTAVGSASQTITGVQTAVSTSQHTISDVSNGLGNLADSTTDSTNRLKKCLGLARQLDNGISDLQKQYGTEDKKSAVTN